MFLFRQEGGRGFKTHLTVFHQTLKSWRQTPSQAAAPALHRPAAQARLHPHSQGGKAPVPSDFPTFPQAAAPSLQLTALQRGLTPLRHTAGFLGNQGLAPRGLQSQLLPAGLCSAGSSQTISHHGAGEAREILNCLPEHRQQAQLEKTPRGPGSLLHIRQQKRMGRCLLALGGTRSRPQGNKTYEDTGAERGGPKAGLLLPRASSHCGSTHPPQPANGRAGSVPLCWECGAVW